MQNDVERKLSGRQGQARRNDARILEAAREVFLEDPEAPISAVAARAGVGIGALYRRYASKQDLLRQLARDGLRRYLAEAEVAIADEGDAWAAFAAFMQRILDSDVLAITINLAGTFTPTDDLMADSTRAEDLNTRLHPANEGRRGTAGGHRGRRPVADPRAGRVAPSWQRATDAPAPTTLPRLVPGRAPNWR